MIEIKPPSEDDKIWDWIWDNITGTEIESISQVVDLIKKYRHECRLHAPLEWEDYGNVSVGTADIGPEEITVRVERYSYSMALSSPDWSFDRKKYPTLEAAKQAAQEYADAELNEGRETP